MARYASNRERCTHCQFGETWTAEFHRLGADCQHPAAASWAFMQVWGDGTISIKPDAPLCPHFVERPTGFMEDLDSINS
ncbi:MAG: hypothetical protein JOZ39_03030 [Chloroflexi bacterium]|nr:hypothetical protein [Chloroflexota bacterium]